MEGITKLFDYNDVNIFQYFHALNFPIGEVIEVEDAPNGKPRLTMYRIEKKRVKVALSGKVHFEYVVNQLNNAVEQQYFIQ